MVQVRKSSKKEINQRENEQQLQRLSKKYIDSQNHMLEVVETSFFHSKNVGIFNSKLRQAADANRTIN